MKFLSLNLNSTLKVSLCSREHLIPPRMHITRRVTTYILYFITAGNLCIKLNGQDIVLGKGDVYLFRKGDMHAPSIATDCEYFYLHFECDGNDIDLPYDEIFHLIKDRNSAIASYEMLDLGRYDHFFTLMPERMHIGNNEVFDYLVGEFKKARLHVWDTGLEKRLEISYNAASLFVKLERIALNDHLSQQKDGYSQNLTAVNQIASFVEANYTSNFSAEDVEKRFSLSYDYANRIFKRHKGTSIIAYRNRLRIEKAKVLLLTTDKSVEAIADETGFLDKYYFSKFFKKTVGVSPTHFKRGEHFAH